jgi:hypothetical protein
VHRPHRFYIIYIDIWSRLHTHGSKAVSAQGTFLKCLQITCAEAYGPVFSILRVLRPQGVQITTTCSLSDKTSTVAPLQGVLPITLYGTLGGPCVLTFRLHGMVTGPCLSNMSYRYAYMELAVLRFVLGPFWGSDRFYKSKSQEKNLPRGRKFSCFAARVNERDLF